MYHCRFETTDPDIQTCDCQTRCLSTGKRIPVTRKWFEDFGLSVRTSNILHNVSPHDMGSMLLWSLRYAMGRRSTAPDDVAGCVQRYWSLSDDAHRRFLFRDLHEEFERAFRCGDHRNLGDRCDVETWARLLFWMRDRVPV